jgi:hypothetical protein
MVRRFECFSQEGGRGRGVECTKVTTQIFISKKTNIFNNKNLGFIVLKSLNIFFWQTEPGQDCTKPETKIDSRAGVLNSFHVDPKIAHLKSAYAIFDWWKLYFTSWCL